jgi:predicted nucleic acid-binding protein
MLQQGDEYLIGAFVRGECDDYIPPLGSDLIARGVLRLVDDPWVVDAVALLSRTHRLGIGELECLAYASRDATLIVCCDDGRARRVIAAQIGQERVVGSIGLLRRCVRNGVLLPAIAQQSYEQMRQAGAYLPVLSATFFQE